MKPFFAGIFFAVVFTTGSTAHSVSAGAKTANNEWLVQFRTPAALHEFTARSLGTQLLTEPLGGNWTLVRSSGPLLDSEALRRDPRVLTVQPNYKIHLIEDYRIKNPGERARLLKVVSAHPEILEKARLTSDKPALPAVKHPDRNRARPSCRKAVGHD